MGKNNFLMEKKFFGGKMYEKKCRFWPSTSRPQEPTTSE